MTTPWRKAIRDFWRERTRTALVVLAIAAGIAGFSAVLSSYAILVRELDRGYLDTNPASATLWLDEVGDELTKAIVANTPVSDAEARREVRGRIRSGPLEWRSLVLFVVKDYGDIRVSVLKPQQGAWPPATGEVLIERDAFQVAKTKIGDTVTIKTQDGVEQTLKVAGSVHDVGQAQARMENMVYGYITLATLEQLGEEPYLDQLKILVRDNRYDPVHVRRVANDVRKFVESRGHAVQRMEVPRPGKHPHADLTGMLMLAKSSFGILVLILSGILVVNLLTALMASQVRQIGVMKALGGTRGQIARIYFGQALLLGVAAVIVAIPAGMWGARVLCRYMAVFLNFDINSFSVPLWVYLLDVAVGIVAPLLAAAWPVWKGSAVSVREALSDYGVTPQAFGTSRFDRMLAGMSGFGRPLLLAMRNSFRRRSRLILTVVTLAAGGLFFMSALNVRASLIHTLDALFGQRNYDLSVGFGEMVQTEAVERAVRATPGIVRAEGWISSRGSMADAKSPAVAPHAAGRHGGGAGDRDSFIVFAVPAATTMWKPYIISGRALQRGDLNAIVVNTAFAAKYPQAKLGDTVAFQMGPGMPSWQVAGIVRESFGPPIAYIPREFYDAHHPGTYNSLRLTLAKTDPDSINRVEAALEENLEKEGLRATTSMSTADSRFGFDQHMVMIYIFLIVASCIIVGVGGLGLTTTMSLNVLERRREMGVLRAIGASPAAVWLIVAAEGAVIGLLSWSLAAIAAWPVSKGIGNAMSKAMFRGGLDFLFEWNGMLVWLAAAIVLSTLASFVPAWHASRGSVREALAYE